jgi:glutamyl/glutaminyl-tRNA synthetase
MSVCLRCEVPADGKLDLVSARAALYGWLFARHAGAPFFLCLIGDRTSPALVAVRDELRLLGLGWDREVEGCRANVSHVFGAPGKAPSLYVPLPPIEGPEAGTRVGEWADRGYSQLALANCLARLGWSPRGKRALLTLDELAERFELERVSRRPVRFERQQLDWFNRRWLCALPPDEVTALLVPRWQAGFGRADRAEGSALSPAQWQETLALAIREELILPEQAVDRARFVFVDELDLDAASQEALAQPYATRILEAFVRELPRVAPFEFDPLDGFSRELRTRFKNALGIRSRDVMYVLRAALTGRQDGPCLVVVCQLLGLDRCIQRAKDALPLFSP